MNKTENKYIKIGETPHTGKTRGFDIVNKSGNYPIGYIEWYRNWRQYCFFSYEDMVFNSQCLELITSAVFVNTVTNPVRLLLSK